MTPPRASTGTGAKRRPLALHEALSGALPDPYTDEEWRALHEGSRRHRRAPREVTFADYLLRQAKEVGNG